MYPVLCRKLFTVPFFARAARIIFFDLHPFVARAARRKLLFYCTLFCLGSFVLYPFARAAWIIFLLYCTPFCLESFLLYFLLRAQREENFLTLLYPFSLRKLLLYPFLLRKLFIVPFLCARSAKKICWLYCIPCCLEKVCVVNFGFQNPRNFQLKRNFPLGRGTIITTITLLYLGRPQGVWESKFPVGNSFLLRGTEKKTQTLKWSGTKQAFWKIEFIFQNAGFLNPKTSPKPSQNLPRSSPEPSQTLPNRPKIESRSFKNWEITLFSKMLAFWSQKLI